jgi:hypothetical protein
MAEYLIQGETLTNIANAVREKTGENETIKLSQLASKISNISTGTTVQRKTGSFTTNTSGKATISDVGFQPDLVYVWTFNYGGYEEGFAIPFAEQLYPNMPYCALAGHANGIYQVNATKTSSGFTVEIYDIGWDWGANEPLLKNKTFNYTAVKYS